MQKQVSMPSIGDTVGLAIGRIAAIYGTAPCAGTEIFVEPIEGQSYPDFYYDLYMKDRALACCDGEDVKIIDYNPFKNEYVLYNNNGEKPVEFSLPMDVFLVATSELSAGDIESCMAQGKVQALVNLFEQNKGVAIYDKSKETLYQSLHWHSGPKVEGPVIEKSIAVIPIIQTEINDRIMQNEVEKNPDPWYFGLLADFDHEEYTFGIDDAMILETAKELTTTPAYYLTPAEKLQSEKNQQISHNKHIQPSKEQTIKTCCTMKDESKKQNNQPSKEVNTEVSSSR